MKLSTVAITRRGFCTSAPINLQDDKAPEGFSWIQIAAEGVFKGHTTGEFKLDGKVFDNIVENFRAHPSYTGTADVVPFDFSHASEEPSAMIGVQGAPAQSWAVELETRQGEEGAELWALTRWLEPARSYVQAGKYKWTSIAVWPDAVDPVTGDDVGWYMSSIAFTNDPFIQGMAPIAAKRQGLTVQLSPDRLLSEIKTWVLGLPETATLEEVATELAKLRAVASGGTPPAGVDVEGLLHHLKILLNLPVLTDAETLFAEIDKLLGAIAATPPAPVPPAPVPSDESSQLEPTPATAARAAQEISVMKEHLLKMARALGVDVPDGDLDDAKASVLAARVHDRMIITLEEGGDSDKVKKAFAAIAKALNVDDADEAVARMTEMMESMNDIKAAMPGLGSLLEGQIIAQDDEEEEDVDRVAAERQWDDDIKILAATTRSGGVEFDKNDAKTWKKMGVTEFLETLKKFATVMAAKRKARDDWREKYPLPDATNVAQNGGDTLLQNLATPRSTDKQQRFASPILNNLDPSTGRIRRQTPGADGGDLPANILQEIDSYDGRNLTERCQDYVAKSNEGKKLAFDNINMKAVMLARKLRAAGYQQPQA